MNKTYFLFTFCFFSFLTAGASLKDNENLEEVIRLYNYDASHLAMHKADSTISELKKQQEIPHELIGEYYRVMSEIAMSIGYNSRIERYVDSMYHYKSQIYDLQETYYVEYAAYKFRNLASLHEYDDYQLKTVYDSCEKIIGSPDFKPEKIDLLFYRLNLFNMIRNPNILEDLFFEIYPHNNHFDLRRFLINELDTSSFYKYDPFRRSLYYRYLGNFMQDLCENSRLNATSEQRIIAANEAIGYYKSAIKIVQDTLGYNNYNADAANAILAYQYHNLGDCKAADSIYNETMNSLSFKIDDKFYYRTLVLPTVLVKMHTWAKLSCGYDEDFTKQVQNAISTHRVRRFYISNYLRDEPNYLRESYAINVFRDLSLMAFEIAHENSALRNEYLEKLWRYSTALHNKELYGHAVRQTLGHQKYDSISSALDSVDLLIFQMTDSLFLGRKANYIIDTSSVKLRMNKINSVRSEVFKNAGVVFSSFQKSKSFISLKEYMASLDKDECTIINISSDFKSNHYRCFLILKDTAIVLKIKSSKSSKSSSIYRKKNKSPFNSQGSFKTYLRYFKPIEIYLKDKQRIKIINSTGFGSRNAGGLDLLCYDTIAPHRFLGEKYAFHYSKNINADMLRDTSPYLNDSRNAVVYGICEKYESSKKTHNVPFSQNLALNLNKRWGAQLITHEQDLADTTFSILHIVAHGQYNKQSFINTRPQRMNLGKSNLYLCDSVINPGELTDMGTRADLVVIASCESGSGVEDNFSGIFDLSRSFFMNGSNAVISSRYTLDDQTTSYILERFYYHLERGEYASRALYLAKLDFLNEIEDPTLRDPRYWATLFYSGNDFKLKKESSPGLIIIFACVITLFFLYLVLLKKSSIKTSINFIKTKDRLGRT